MRRFGLTALALAGLLCATLAVASPARAEEWNKSYKLSGRPNLRVITNDGHVDLYSSDSSQIDAHVTTTGWPIAKSGGDRGVKITESQSGNEVTIEVHVPSFHFSFGWNNRGVRIELHVPRNADFDVETGDGSVTSQAFSGNLRISTGDGNIDAHGLKGEVRLHSGDGHIDGEDFDGSLHADSGDGRITVRGRFDKLTLESGDGSVIVRLPDGLNADLDAHTGDGSITLDFPVTVSGSLSRSTIRGKIGSGGPPLMVHTGDGSIHIEKM